MCLSVQEQISYSIMITDECFKAIVNIMQAVCTVYGNLPKAEAIVEVQGKCSDICIKGASILKEERYQ